MILSSTVFAQDKNIITGWTENVEKACKDDVSVDIGDAVEIKRGPRGAERYLSRAIRDIDVKPGTYYLFSFTVVVEGPGAGYAFVHIATNGAWDEKNIIYSERRKKGEPPAVRVVVAAPANGTRIRLSLAADGPSTTVRFTAMTLEAVGERTEVRLLPSTAAVVLDGKLDDPLWKDAATLTPFRVLGDPARAAKQRNEVRLAVRDGRLYVAYRCEEPNVAGMRALATDDARSVYQDDCVETFISIDKKRYGHVIVNPRGRRYWDERGDTSGVTWYPAAIVPFAGEWEAKAAVGNGEWTCEFSVSINDLFGREVAGAQRLFVNFTRHRTQGDEEHTTWVPLATKDYHVPKEFAPLTLVMPGTPPVANTIPGKRRLSFTKLLGTPDLLIAGTPVNLAMKGGVLKLPGESTILEKNVAVDTGVKRMLKEMSTVPAGSGVSFVFEAADVFNDPSLTTDERALLASPEAFRLELATDRVSVTGRTRDGVLRGIATFILMANRARFLPEAALPNLVMYDAPRMKFRGWLIESGKPIEGVKRTIDLAYLMRLNKVFIFMDSFGGDTAFPFTVADIGDKTRTKEEWIDAYEYARARGIEPIPYIASWGRVQYITGKPEYRQFMASDIGYEGTRNLDVANPEAQKLMLALQGELIDTLKPKGIHIAFDELYAAEMTSSPLARAKQWKASDWIIEALTVNSAFCRSKGVDMYLWGDMIDPLHNAGSIHHSGIKDPDDIVGPALLARLPKDMIVLDWKYGGHWDTAADYPSVRMFVDAGVRTVGCPWFCAPNVAGIASAIYRAKGEGVCLTSWGSASIGSMRVEAIRSLALTAFYTWSPEDCDLEHFSFVPDTLVKFAALVTNAAMGFARNARALAVREGLTGEEELSKRFGPSNVSLDFVRTKFTNYRGVSPEVFTMNGRAAAIVVDGGSGPLLKNGDFSQGTDGYAEGERTVVRIADVALVEKGTAVATAKPVRIAVNDTAKAVTFLHTVNDQGISDTLAIDSSKFRDILSRSPGAYRVRYADGSTARIPLTFRANITDMGTAIGRDQDVGLFGTLGGRYFVNLPTYTWVNPSPEKGIDAIEIVPGSSKEMSLMLFGISIE
jgi:hypothetical protein